MSLLYLDHFGLKKPPFKITPDLDFFFAGGRRGDVLTALLHVARHEEGIITVVAEVGSGKTLISRLMISQLGNDVCTVYLSNPCFSRDEILSAIGRDLGLTDLPSSTEAKLSALQHELLRRHALSQRVLLVVDEAHAMPPESLEEVRLLSNLETGSHKLVNIMLFGQPELDELLADRRLRQVRDRVIHRFELEFLPPAEAGAYIDHRLRAAGWRGGVLFESKALALLVKESGGRARRINLLADKALLAAYAQGTTQVELAHVESALQDLHADLPKREPLKSVWRERILWAGAAAIMASGLTAGGVWWLGSFDFKYNNSVANVDKTHEVVDAPTALNQEIKQTQQLAKKDNLQVEKPESSDQALDKYLLQTQKHLNNSSAKIYTIQLAALPRDANVNKYLNMVSQNVDSAMVFARLSSYNNKKYVSVFFGDFQTAAQANTTIGTLPEALKTNKPILRTWAKIRTDKED